MSDSKTTDDRHICDYPVCSVRGAGHPLACNCRSWITPPAKVQKVSDQTKTTEAEQIVLAAAYAYASANKDMTSPMYREKYYQTQGNLLRAAAALVGMQETPNAN